MSQSTLDDEELFGEAASEMRADVTASLESARAAVPDPEEVWSVEGENVLGVLNGLRSALAAEDARADLRDAKKWYTMGERADAFDGSGGLAEEIASLEALLDDLERTRDAVGDLASDLPELRGRLEDLAPEEVSTDADADREVEA